MSTEFFNDQWRIPSNENQNKVSNYSMDFDSASSDYIDIGTISSLNTTQNFSISLWFNEKARGYTSQLFSSGTGNGNLISVSSRNGTLNIYVGNSGYQPIASVSLNTWYHVVLTVENTTAKVYINNGSPTTVTVGSINSSSGNLAKIGVLSFTSGQKFTGQIDGVSIFNYALSSSQVTTLYGSSSTGIGNPMSLSPAPVAYYQLGDQSVDSGANYLVPNNSLQDYVFDFDGSDDRITTDFNFPLLTTNFSFSVWIKPENTTIANVFIANNDSASDGYNSFIVNNSVYFRLNSSDLISSISGLANTWIHVVGTYDGSTQKLYINNNTPSTKSFSTSLSVNDVTLIGVQENLTNYFNGSISNVSLYNTTLTDLQVATLYNNGAPNDISSLSPVAWYKLNAADTFDGSDWTINDYGSGGNDGTSSGMDSSNLVVSDLQQTSGYSPYALDFDGVNDYLDFNNASANIMTNKNAISISGWFKLDSNTSSTVFSNWWGGTDVQYLLRYNTAALTGVQWYIYSNSSSTIINTDYFPNVGDWVHVVGVKDPTTSGGQSRVYINGFEYTKNSTDLSVAIANNSRSDQIGVFSIGMLNLMNGSISNVAYWTDTALTQVQVTEIYNQGVPSNLNNFSGTAPDHWLQIGSNSSFNTNWTCLDEIGTSNAVSVNMTNNDIVDGPGYSASGLGTSSIDIKGDAPYSTANGLSENMDVLDRTTDVPS